MLVKELLMSTNYWVLNKQICKEFGFEPAIILSVFAEAETLKGDENGWFYQTSKTIEDMTGLSNYQQTKSIKILIDKKILIQENRGIPMKRYFKISYEEILNQVFKKLKNYNSKNLKTNIENTLNNKELINKELINKELNNKESNIYPSEFETVSIKLQEKIKEFVEYRKQIKKSLKTERPIKTMINNLGKEYASEEHLIQCIDKAMEKEWVGVKGEYVKVAKGGVDDKWSIWD